MLIDKNADININGGFLLNHACGNSEIIQLLINEGINYDRNDEIIQICVQNDDDHSLAILMQHDIIKITPNQTIPIYCGPDLLIFDACIFFKAINKG